MMNTQQFSFQRAVAAAFLGTVVLATGMPALGQQTATQPVAAVTAPPALSAEALQVKSAIERRFGAGSAVAGAYAGRGFAPVWLDQAGKPTTAATQLIHALQSAGKHGLPEAKYGGANLASRMTSGGWSMEADLTAAFVDYASDMAAGVLNPRSIDSELHIFPERPDAGWLVSQAGSAPSIEAYLASLLPQNPAYQRLVERYAAFRLLADQNIWGEKIGGGRTLRPGQRSNRVAQARARLTAMGDLDPNVYDQQVSLVPDGTQLATNEVTTDVPVPSFEPRLFDEPMVDALRRFQERHGLNLDGVIGPATLKQLNVSPQTRARQIAVNLERMRWLNRDLGDKYVLVNLAGFTMAVINNGREEFTSRVVVGKAKEHRTPEFSDTMTHMVINPSWYVPSSIANEEIRPKLAADPNYLVNRNMRQLSNGRIVQRPGPRNALGTVKFMFPNKFAIYLHDTPSKRLFKRDVRAYSHGCVRVERPHDFAEYLLTGQQADPGGYFQSILRRGKERRVDLDDPLPVHLTYRSAWIDDVGVEQFRGDIYGRDQKIASALIAAGAISR